MGGDRLLHKDVPMILSSAKHAVYNVRALFHSSLDLRDMEFLCTDQKKVAAQRYVMATNCPCVPTHREVRARHSHLSDNSPLGIARCGDGAL
jgi:hypothetical protein